MLLSLAGNVRLAFATLTVKNGFDVKERIDFAFKSLTRLYELRPFRPRVWKRIKEAFYEELKAYEQNLEKLVKAGRLRKSEAERKVGLQKTLFKKFEKRYKNLPNAKQLKFGQIFPAVWAFELTYDPATGIHPHWHGVLIGEIPKLLLTVLWKEATKGEAYITDIRFVAGGKEARKQVLDYVNDYLADGFVDVGDISKADKELLIEVEEALHGRRKVRAWGFDLIKGNNSDSSPYQWVHAHSVALKVLPKSGKKNLADYWKVRRKVRKQNKREPYLVVEFLLDREIFGRRMLLLGYLTPDGLIELEPVNVSDEDDWQNFVVALFDYGGRISELLTTSDAGYFAPYFRQDFSELGDLGIEL